MIHLFKFVSVFKIWTQETHHFFKDSSIHAVLCLFLSFFLNFLVICSDFICRKGRDIILDC